jgi:hypothetical protein
MNWSNNDDGRLIRFHTRFRPATFSEIQQLEQQTGRSKAEIIRVLVRASLNSVNFANSSDKVKDSSKNRR